MNRLASVLGGVALLACFSQACSSDESTGGNVDEREESTSSGDINRDASTTRPGSSSGGGASSSSGSSSGSSTSSGSSGSPEAGTRCDLASERTEARYTECAVSFVILDGGAPPACTDERAADAERISQCVQNASCAALRGDADASAEAATYYACISGAD